MTYNRDEAIKAKEIAEKKFADKDLSGAKLFALKAQRLFPSLEGLPQFLTTIDVYISAQKRINGVVNWYDILGVDPWADDDTIRKHYTKLALVLHPGRNKSIGAEGAFRIVSQAWAFLSDKAKRIVFDENKSVWGIHENFSEQKSSIQTGTSEGDWRTAAHPKPNLASQPAKLTFWSICNACKSKFEIIKVYLNNKLICPNCREAFFATEKSQLPLDAQISDKQPQNFTQLKMFTSYAAEKIPTFTNSGNARFSCVDSMKKTFQSGTLFEAGSSSFPKEDMLKKKRQASDDMLNSNGGNLLNQTETENREVFKESVSRNRKPSFETGSIQLAGNFRSSNIREFLKLQMRNMLMDKARNEIRKKLNEWNMTAKSTAFEKSWTTEKEVSEKVDAKGADPILMSVLDPDFHDFDKKRTEKSFGKNQVWAVYDDGDGMPRYYVLVRSVLSQKPFKVQISWLTSKTNNELATLNWIDCGFPKTVGDFRLGKHELNCSMNSFSHKVKFQKGAGGSIQIYPIKGDVWALYKNWSPDWNELTPNDVVRKYEMVEVLEDYNVEKGVMVASLVKVVGFRTVFRKYSESSRRIPREEMFRFSHQVPSYVLTGFESQNAPKDCLELDPASVPIELLQVEKGTSERDEMVHKEKELKEIPAMVYSRKRFRGQKIIDAAE